MLLLRQKSLKLLGLNRKCLSMTSTYPNYTLTFNHDKSEVIYQLKKEANMHGKITDMIDDHGLDTVPKLFDFSCGKYAQQAHLGTRKILQRNMQLVNGKSMEKLVLDDKYTWQTYQQIHDKVTKIAKGFNKLGYNAGDQVVIYAETSPEWYLAAMACLKNAMVIGTLYTSLGDSGITSGINQLGAKTIITNAKLVDKVLSLKKDLPTLKNIIILDDDDAIQDSTTDLNLQTLDSIEEMGSKVENVTLPEALPENHAVIMFTSGSTGDPKGVILRHETLIGNAKYVCGPGNEHAYHYNIHPGSTYAAYLPLAHIFEFCQEISSMAVGLKIGYSSPLTLTDAGTALAPGQKGDIGILKPTSMVAVPAVMNKIYSALNAKLSAKGPIFSKFFQTMFNIKNQALSKQKSTPLLDKILFNKIKDAFGGNLQAIVVSGAPFSADVQNYLKTVLCPTLMPGYGMTETAGGIIMCRNNEVLLDHVGLPFHHSIRIKMRDWNEGGYKVTNSKGPQGEILVSGPVVAEGYWNQPDLTNEAFIKDEHGQTWFCSGDIGHFDLELGVFKIIDRKKDLIKLQMGQFVSLGKVEACLRVNPIVENVCVIADPMKSHVVALIVPESNALKKLGSSDDPKVVNAVLETLKNHCSSYLKTFEIPQRIALIDQPWTPESGLVTATLKPKRKAINEKFKDVIAQIYQ